jgi:hypothetical protein
VRDRIEPGKQKEIYEKGHDRDDKIASDFGSYSEPASCRAASGVYLTRFAVCRLRPKKVLAICNVRPSRFDYRVAARSIEQLVSTNSRYGVASVNK